MYFCIREIFSKRICLCVKYEIFLPENIIKTLVAGIVLAGSFILLFKDVIDKDAQLTELNAKIQESQNKLYADTLNERSQEIKIAFQKYMVLQNQYQTDTSDFQKKVCAVKKINDSLVTVVARLKKQTSLAIITENNESFFKETTDLLKSITNLTTKNSIGLNLAVSNWNLRDVTANHVDKISVAAGSSSHSLCAQHETLRYKPICLI